MSISRNLRRRQFIANGPNISPATTYAGEASDIYVAPALLGADTLANNWVTQLDGLQNKAVVSGASVSDPLQTGTAGAACDFVDGQNVTIDERVLTLSEVKVNEELCRARILPTWQGMTGARNSMDWSSDSFRNFVIATVAAKTAEGVENAIWKSKSGVMTSGFLSNSGTFDNTGWEASVLQDAGATEVVILAPTSTTAIAEFNKVYTKMAETTPAVLTKPDTAFYCSPKTYALYAQELAGLGSSAASRAGQGINNQGAAQSFVGVGFMGIPIHVSGGIPDACIVMAQESNLYVGSNLRTDYTEAAYIPVYQFDGSDNVRVTMRFGLGCQVGTGSEVVVGALTSIL